MESNRDTFELSGPLHLQHVDWKNADHRRSVTASLVQGVYVLERDRQLNRLESQALAPPWWQFFHFQLLNHLVDSADSCIFGAVYEYKPQSSHGKHLTEGAPRYVIAFRGTITKGNAFSQDLKLDLHFIQNGLHTTSRFEIAMQAVRNQFAACGDFDIWLTGHSLGSAMAMLAGKNMAKTGVLPESFLFNPPFFSPPIERIKDKKVKHGLRFAGSLVTAGLALAMKGNSNNNNNNNNQRQPSEDPFLALAVWVPSLFVNPADHICSEYIGYFEHRQKMEDMGIGAIERLATQHSMGDLFMDAFGKGSGSDPLHLIPSANLSINPGPSKDFKDAHGIHQWWRPDLRLESKLYNYR